MIIIWQLQERRLQLCLLSISFEKQRKPCSFGDSRLTTLAIPPHNWWEERKAGQRMRIHLGTFTEVNIVKLLKWNSRLCYINIIHGISGHMSIFVKTKNFQNMKLDLTINNILCDKTPLHGLKSEYSLLISTTIFNKGNKMCYVFTKVLFI